MTPTEGTVRVEWPRRADGARVASIVVDRPARLNVLDTAMIAALRDAFVGLAGDAGLRAVVLRGAGERAWIGGADIGEMVSLAPDGAEAFITRLHEACAAIMDCPVPVVAAIDGYCLGAGLEVAAACDLRVATADAVFGMPEVRIGIPSVIEAALLPRLVGQGWAARLVLTGEPIDADTAQRTGLIEEAVDSPALGSAIDRLVGAIVAAGPRAVRAQKALLRAWRRLPLDEAIAAGVPAFRDAFADDEPRRLMRAFLDRTRG